MDRHFGNDMNIKQEGCYILTDFFGSRTSAIFKLNVRLPHLGLKKILRKSKVKSMIKK